MLIELNSIVSLHFRSMQVNQSLFRLPTIAHSPFGPSNPCRESLQGFMYSETPPSPDAHKHQDPRPLSRAGLPAQNQSELVIYSVGVRLEQIHPYRHLTP